MTRHDEKGVKEWGNIKHWGKKNSGLHMVVTLKCLVEGKMTKYALIKKSKGHSHNGMGERTVFYNPDL